jgi:type I restriction enzyme, S subunit
MKFKKYPKYKDSGVEWIGEIPEGWEVKKLKFLIKNITKGTTPSTLGKSFVDVGVHFLKVENISKNGLIDISNCSFIDNETNELLKRSKLKENNILVSIAGAIGRSALVSKEILPANTNQAVAIISLNINTVSPNWVVYCFNSSYLDSFFENNQVMSAQANLSLENLGNIPLVIPSLIEGKQIEEFLKKQTTQFDELISKSKEQIIILEEKRQATINQAVTKGLDPSVKMKDSGVEWIGDIPEEWELQKLNYLKKEGTSITYGIVQPGPDVEDGVPYIQATNMKGRIFSPKKYYKKTSQAIANQYSRSQVHEGDIVMAIRATIGNAMIIPDFLDGANLDRGPSKISPGDKIHGRFLLYYLNSLNTQQYIKSELLGATITGITLEFLRKLIVILPPKDKQIQIAEFLDKKTTQFDELIAKSKKQITILEEKRQALITAAVTGKIDVRN